MHASWPHAQMFFLLFNIVCLLCSVWPGREHQNTCLQQVFKMSQKQGQEYSTHFSQNLIMIPVGEWILSHPTGHDAEPHLWGLWNVVSWLVFTREVSRAAAEVPRASLCHDCWLFLDGWGAHRAQGYALWFHNRTKDNGSAGGLSSRAMPCSFFQWVPVSVETQSRTRRVGGGAGLRAWRRMI